MQAEMNNEDNEQQNNTRQFNEDIYFPADCLLPIFDFCDLQVVFSLPLVCTTWNTVLKKHEQPIWENLCHSEFPMLKEVMAPTPATVWRDVFLKRAKHVPYNEFRIQQDDFNKRYLDLLNQKEQLLKSEPLSFEELNSNDEMKLTLLMEWVCIFSIVTLIRKEY
jgi:hypothetical protein